MKTKLHPFWKYLIAAVTVILLSVFCEAVLANLHAFTEDTYRATVSTEYYGTEDGITLDLGERRYIKNVTVEYACDSNMDILLTVFDENGEEVTAQELTLEASLGLRVANLHIKGARVEVQLKQKNVSEDREQLFGARSAESDTVEAPGTVKLSAANFFEWNDVRFLFFLAVFGLGAFLIVSRTWIREKPEYIFMVIALTVGILLIQVTGTNQISYDEQTHVAQTVNVSYIGTVYDTDAVLALKTLTVPTFHNVWERAAAEEYLDALNDYDTANITYQTKMISYNKRAYLPLAVFMAIGRMIRLPFAMIIEFSKLGNLLMYVLICFFAIRCAKKGKAMVAVIALLPNNLFSASQFSYDPCVNCFLLLAMVLVMNELLEPERVIRPRHMAAILTCFIIGSYSKQIYILMALLMLFFSWKKFPSKAKAVLFKLSLTALCLFMVYEVLSPSYTVSSAAARLASAGDSRTEGTGTLKQIYYILENPWTFTEMLLTSMWNKLTGWFTAKDEFLMYGYLGTPGTRWTYLWFGTLIFASAVGLKEEKRRSIGKGYIALSLLMVFCMSAVIWTVLYLSFNAVGSTDIQGVQNRYFAPVFLPLFMCLMNGRLNWRWHAQSYYRLIFSVLAVIHLYAIWSVGIAVFYI